MRVIVKINGVEILVNARTEEVEKIEIVISDEGTNEVAPNSGEGTNEVAPTSTTENMGGDETNVEEPHEPHYCNVNCSCKYNEKKK